MFKYIIRFPVLFCFALFVCLFVCLFVWFFVLFFVFIVSFNMIILSVKIIISTINTLKGVLRTSYSKNSKLACFVLYLKFINISLKTNIRIL